MSRNAAINLYGQGHSRGLNTRGGARSDAWISRLPHRNRSRAEMAAHAREVLDGEGFNIASNPSRPRRRR